MWVVLKGCGGPRMLPKWVALLAVRARKREKDGLNFLVRMQSNEKVINCTTVQFKCKDR